MPLQPKISRMFGAAALLILFSGSARALDIDESRVLWGFDGQASPNSFNIVSIPVDNPTPEPFDGVFELREESGTGHEVGAVLVSEVFVAPFSSRWVQFYPYMKPERNEWFIRWGRSPRERLKLSDPRFGEQSPILLVEPTGLQGRGDSLKHFPEDLFPPMVTATDGLRNVVLDHAPRWEESRRQAFLDWLYRGGRVHLIKNVAGEYPKFSTGLSELNAPLDRFRIGSGEVIRHDVPRGQLDRKFVDSMITGISKTDSSAGASNDGSDPNGNANGTNPNTAPQYPVYGDPEQLFGDFTGGMLSALKNLTRPQHNWELIYFMAVLYTLAIFPGLFLLGRRRMDYRLVYGILAGVVILFSLGFAHVGRRGHDEVTGVNTLAIARQLPDGALDVSGWSNIFVTSGNDYRISHAGSGRLYSAAEPYEKVRGEVSYGANASFLADIPPFSSRPFVHREKVKQEPFEFQVESFVGGEALSQFIFKVGGNFPKAKGGTVYALYRDRIYQLNVEQDKLVYSSSPGDQIASFLGNINAEQFTYYRYNYAFAYQEQTQVSPDAVFNAMLRPMIAWSLGEQRRTPLQKFQLPDDRVRLFVPADLPENLKVDNPQLGRQNGLVLYVVDIPKPVTP